MNGGPEEDGTTALPPAPARRSISPAGEDFAGATPMGAWAWPLLWCALAALLISVL